MEASKQEKDQQKPVYEAPSVRELTEKEILESFQITQAMATWWGAC